MRALVAVALAVALSGCIQGIFVDTEQTTRRFLCAALDPEDPLDLAIEVRVDPGAQGPPLEAVGRMQAVLEGLRSPDAAPITITIQTIEDAPSTWDDAAWEEALAGHSFRRDLRTVVLVVYWLPGLDADATGLVPSPGVLVFGEQALQTKAVATGHSLESVTFAVLLHHLGHALGAVNQGAPMQANHEGGPGHDADEASVLHASWHDASDPTWAPGASYAGYGAAVLDDWTAAIHDPKVCP